MWAKSIEEIWHMHNNIPDRLLPPTSSTPLKLPAKKNGKLALLLLKLTWARSSQDLELRIETFWYVYRNFSTFCACCWAKAIVPQCIVQFIDTWYVLKNKLISLQHFNGWSISLRKILTHNVLSVSSVDLTFEVSLAVYELGQMPW